MLKDSNIVVRVVWGLVLVGVMALGAGCTSDPSSPVGAGLINDQIDGTLQSLELSAIEAFSGIRVENPDVKIHEQQTLYLGTEADTRTSMLVNFDFTDIFTEVFPDTLFVTGNIKSVKLGLTKLLVYYGDIEADSAPGVPPYELKFWVNEIAAPFDPLDYEDYPVVAPETVGASLNVGANDFNSFNEIFLVFREHSLLTWVENAKEVGMKIQLSDDTAPGLVGFAASELIEFTEVPDLLVGTVVGPVLLVEFNNTADVLQILPSADTTVFEALSLAPEIMDDAADIFVLRTGLRSYPAFRFDLTDLPQNALVNRAVLTVVNDTLTSYGPDFSVMISEITAVLMDDPYADSLTGKMDVAAMKDEAKVYPLTFRSNLGTGVDGIIEFDITTGIRRAINLVNEEPRGFLLSAVEDKSVFPFGSQPLDPTDADFYYRQMSFFGLEDVDRAPRLKVWYSVIDDLSGGVQ